MWKVGEKVESLEMQEYVVVVFMAVRVVELIDVRSYRDNLGVNYRVNLMMDCR